MTGRWRRIRWAVLCLAGSSPVAAQTTGTPSFMAPPPPRFVSSLGFYASNGNRGNGGAFEAEYRFVPRSRRFDFGLRAGIADDSGSTGSAKLVGIDGRYSFFHESPEFPVDAAVTIGVGTRIHQGSSITLVPVGATFGRRLTPPSGAVLVTTYMHPKLIYVGGDTRQRVVFNMTVGLNLLFSRGFEIRVGGAAGEFGGFGLGLILFRPLTAEAPEVSGGGGGP